MGKSDRAARIQPHCDCAQQHHGRSKGQCQRAAGQIESSFHHTLTLDRVERAAFLFCNFDSHFHNLDKPGQV